LLKVLILYLVKL